jgi:hypothetical protein
MQEKAWEGLLDRLEDKYGEVKVQRREDIRNDDLGNEIKSQVQFVEFDMSGNSFRVEKITSPMILDKKTHYTHTAGARANIEYILSETETTSKMKVFRFDNDEDDWIEIQASDMSF